MNQEESVDWIRKKCGEGWVPLVKEIYTVLPDGVIVTSIYQKWGGLMFDASPWNDMIERIHDEIESKSRQICEVCGDTGKEVNTNNWTHTRCEKHTN